METTFALLYWPVAGVLLVWLRPNRTDPDHGLQSNVLLIVWLFISITIPDLIQQTMHPTTIVLRVLCGPLHGWREEVPHCLLMLSSLIPLLVWRILQQSKSNRKTAIT
jgi:hypothetical protein